MMKTIAFFSVCSLLVPVITLAWEITDDQFSRIMSFDAFRFQAKMRGESVPGDTGVSWFMKKHGVDEYEMATSLVQRASSKYNSQDFRSAADSISRVSYLPGTNTFDLVRIFSNCVTNEQVLCACIYAETRALGLDSVSYHMSRFDSYTQEMRVQMYEAFSECHEEREVKINVFKNQIDDLIFKEEDEMCQSAIDAMLEKLIKHWKGSEERSTLIQVWIGQADRKNQTSIWEKKRVIIGKQEKVPEFAEKDITDVPVVSE